MATPADRSTNSASNATSESASAHPFAVVTGASSGIGYELARQLLEHGYDVLAVAEEGGIHEAAQQLSSAGARAEALQADLSSRSGVELLVSHITRGGRTLDVLVLNAGIGVGGAFLETSLEDELEMIRLNVVSVVHTCKELLPRMVARGEGRVLITASIASDMPAPFLAVYGATKAFVLSFAEAIRNELKDTGVTVTALQPGATDTNFFARADMEDTKVAQGKKDDPADVARMGLEAMFAGDDKVVAASLSTRIQDALAQITPEAVKAQMHRKLSEPGSANP